MGRLVRKCDGKAARFHSGNFFFSMAWLRLRLGTVQGEVVGQGPVDARRRPARNPNFRDVPGALMVIIRSAETDGQTACPSRPTACLSTKWAMSWAPVIRICCQPTIRPPVRSSSPIRPRRCTGTWTARTTVGADRTLRRLVQGTYGDGRACPRWYATRAGDAEDRQDECEDRIGQGVRFADGAGRQEADAEGLLPTQSDT